MLEKITNHINNNSVFNCYINEDYELDVFYHGTYLGRIYETYSRNVLFEEDEGKTTYLLNFYENEDLIFDRIEEFIMNYTK